jgi:hypothetical protein
MATAIITDATTNVNPLASLSATRQPSAEALARREFSSKCMEELCSFSKTQKVVTKFLKSVDITSLESREVHMNRVSRILASKKLVEALMTAGEKTKYLELGQRVTPNQYLTIVRRGCTMQPKKWDALSAK